MITCDEEPAEPVDAIPQTLTEWVEFGLYTITLLACLFLAASMIIAGA